MKTSEFLSLLEKHKGMELLFEYQNGTIVPANYHITEVKNVAIDSVDCGGRTDFWRETIIQLWESPSEIGKTDFMTAFKALGILNRVDKLKPMHRDTELKFEYGNANFHTAQLFVDGFKSIGNRLVLTLAVDKTACKAEDVCGVPVEAVKEASTSCAPGTGCC